MNKRTTVIGILAVVLLLLLGSWRYLASRHVSPSEQKTASSANAVASNGTVKQPNASNAQPASASAPTPTPVDPKVAKMEARVAAENSTPIDVYGKVIDQSGQPVIDAKVKGGTLLIEGYDRSGGEAFSTVTDTQGRFSFTGLHGARFGLGIEKPGYVYDPKRYLGWWDGYRPDPDNPVIFRMWKLQGAEPMKAYSISTSIPCDGTPTGYNLLTGQKMPAGGDLVVKLMRNPINIDRSKPFDWSVTLEISGGGLIDINDLYPNEAPADGYQSSVTVEMSPETKNWQAALTHSFYFKSGENYGRMTINIQADFQPPPTYFGADVHINPSGSRNLEFDPAKQVR